MNTQAIPIISCPDAKRLLEQRQAVLVDVRENDEFSHEHIPGARHIPLMQCGSVVSAVGTDKTIILQCQGGNRSKQAAAQILETYPEVTLYSLDGGIVSWRTAGFPTEKSGRAPLPLMRQVQIVAGSMVFGGVILALTVAKAFWIVPAFVGAGLVFAGVTGTCGLASALSLMPWNRDNNRNGAAKGCCLKGLEGSQSR